MRRERALFYLHHIGPATAREVAECHDNWEDGTEVSPQLKGLVDEGMAVRSVRITKDYGSHPYEYSVAPMGDEDAPEDDWKALYDMEGDA